MNRPIYYICLLLAALQLASCKNTNETDMPSAGLCVIQNAQLGKMKRTIYTQTNTGKDTIFVVPVSGWHYPLTIDQLGLRIFNLDSLPKNTNLKRAIFKDIRSTSLTTIKSLQSGKDTIFNLKDTLDLSVPRELTVWGSDGISHRTYTLDIRMHKQIGTEYSWSTQAKSSDLSQLGLLSAFATDNNFTLFGKRKNGIYRYTAPINHLNALTSDAINIDIDPSTIIRNVDGFYALANKQLVFSPDGLTWSYTAAPQHFDHILSGTKLFITAINAEGIWNSTNGGKTFENVEKASDLLPNAHIASITLDKNNGRIQRQLLFGTRDGKKVIWQRDIEPQGNIYPWVYAPSAGEWPELKETTLFVYNRQLILAGINKLGLPSYFVSKDEGLNWEEANLQIPIDFVPRNMGIATNTDHYIFAVDNKEGRILRGRLNKLGWEKPTTIFE